MRQTGVRFLDNIISYLSEVTNGHILLLIPVFAVLILLLTVFCIIQNKKSKSFKFQMDIMSKSVDALYPATSLDNYLNSVLCLVYSIVKTNIYSFYLFDSKKNEYILKATRYSTGEGESKIAPSYSGLLPYIKETYVPPLSILHFPLPSKTIIKKEGEVSLLLIPIKNGKGFIYAGPVARASAKTLASLDTLAENIHPFLEIILEVDKIKNQVEFAVASSRAISNLSSIIRNDDEIFKGIIAISVKAIGAEGGFFLKRESGNCSIEASVGADEKARDFLHKDTQTLNVLFDIIGNNNNGVLILRNNEKDYYKLPTCFAAVGVKMLILVNIKSEPADGIAGFWYYDVLDIEEYRISALLILTKRIGDIIINGAKLKQLSSSYIDKLIMLAQMVDSINPYLAGHCELMCRFSAVIAKELNLNATDIKEICLAAYLSNIGVLALSNDLLHKEGRYSDVEYEMMKLHSDVGASIIDAMISNSRIASYIRHHHERIDGYGYPAGLKGDEIPVGARIIAVVQTFLAKIKGRADREPMPFKKALESLKSSAGTQLDPEIVEVLVNWFKKKQDSLSGKNSSLGKCWEMTCAPESVCISCPVYMNAGTRNCWEFQENNCASHGSKCSSCFVFTEYVERCGHG